jgi:uncharacterized membrane-anchored protein
VILLALACIAQLAVPAWDLIGHERTLARGELFRFECAPVDPVDVVRGRYVALRFPAASVAKTEAMRFGPGERLYVRVEQGKDGFAELSRPSRTPPEGGAYLRVQATGSQQPTRMTVVLPFDRYYLDENLAPEAESAYHRRAAGSKGEVYAEVKIRNGKAAMKELYIDGIPIREYLLRNPVAKP